MIVDQHQPVVEKYYGAGKMKSVVMRLLDECDHTTKNLLVEWEEERSMKRKVGFTCDEQMRGENTDSFSDKLADTHNNPPIPMFTTSGRRQPLPSGNEESPIDLREIDKILSEIAGMLGRWGLFKRFLLESLNVRG